MGQYYLIVNVDKKEYIHPHNFGNGMKLMEWSWNGNRVIKALSNLMMGDWKGDRVYVVGDYADLAEYNPYDENWLPTLRVLTEELGIHDGNHAEYPDERSLFAVAESKFTKLSPDETEWKETDARYIYNPKTMQYIDIENSPKTVIEFYDGESATYCASPLSLILAMGNNRGGGDYRNKTNEHLVGLWVPYSQHLVVTNEKAGNHDDFHEFKPDFKEA